MAKTQKQITVFYFSAITCILYFTRFPVHLIQFHLIGLQQDPSLLLEAEKLDVYVIPEDSIVRNLLVKVSKVIIDRMIWIYRAQQHFY